MKIAVDAMGGDNAPQEVVRGCVQGARDHNVGVILVGQKDKIEAELKKYDTAGLNMEIVHTDEYLVEGEQPAYALRTKRNASIAVACKMVKGGQADAVYSAGPTGGVVAAALGYLGTLEGISRPVIGGHFAGFAPKTVIMDLGGNVDCRPDQLLDFAIVGTVYAKKLLGVPNPTVSLLSIGSEEGKGNELCKASYPLFRKSGLNFTGNVEGYDIMAGKTNVIICDGFIGNILMKFYESLGRTFGDWFLKNVQGKMAEGDVKELIKSFISATNPADMRGGGPLWAIDGLVVKAHGKSKHDDFAQGLKQAKQYLELDVIGALRAEIATVRSNLQVSSA